jgi:hypothetical protein
MSVVISFLPEMDDACYPLELLETQSDGGEVYVCITCGYKRVFYWDNPSKSYTMACQSSANSHRHCLSIRPEGSGGGDALSVDLSVANKPVEQIEAPEGWEPRRQIVRRGTLGGWLTYEITAIEMPGTPFNDSEGGSCRI